MRGNWACSFNAGHLTGCDKKSEIVRYLQGRLCDKKGYYAVNYAIFPSTILSFFSQDSKKVNHVYAALATIFS